MPKKIVGNSYAHVFDNNQRRVYVEKGKNNNKFLCMDVEGGEVSYCSIPDELYEAWIEYFGIYSEWN